MKLLKAAALAALLCAPGGAGAVTYTFTTVDPYDPVMTGASGVEVDGFLYDVTFFRGKTLDVYWELPFEFDALQDATAAGQALLDQVFVDDPSGDADKLYDSLTSLTHSLPVSWSQPVLGEARQPTGDRPYSNNTDNANFLIAYGSVPGSSATAAVAVFNDGNETKDRLATVSVFASTVENWAVFTQTGPVTAVPLPAPVLMLGAGLAALGLRRRKRSA